MMGKSATANQLQPIVIEGVAYFASDFHFGAPNVEASRQRETLVLQWLDAIAPEVNHLFLLGDIFDFWFEYRDVVPRGYFRFFAKLLELRDKGVEIYYFTGNHDMWVKDYFIQELGMRIFREPQHFVINGKHCFIGHGDGLDPKDRGYLFIKKLFAMRAHIAMYGALPPRWAFKLARFCSHTSRAQNDKAYAQNEEKARRQEESTLEFIRNVLQSEHYDYFIFGHRHLPMEVSIEEGVIYYNTGDWIQHNSYLRMSQEFISLSL